MSSKNCSNENDNNHDDCLDLGTEIDSPLSNSSISSESYDNIPAEAVILPHNKSQWYASGIIIMSPDLEKIALVKGKKNGKWGFPKGSRENFQISGKKFKETVYQTATRETLEEIGLKEVQDYSIISGRHAIGEIKRISGNAIKCSIFYLVAIAKLDDKGNLPTLNPLPEFKCEISQLGWYSIEKANELLSDRRKYVLNNAYTFAISNPQTFACEKTIIEYSVENQEVSSKKNQKKRKRTRTSST